MVYFNLTKPQTFPAGAGTSEVLLMNEHKISESNNEKETAAAPSATGPTCVVERSY